MDKKRKKESQDSEREEIDCNTLLRSRKSSWKSCTLSERIDCTQWESVEVAKFLSVKLAPIPMTSL